MLKKKLSLTPEAHEYCFKSIFATVKETCPQFEVGKTLLGVILDWSDQQMKGLEGAVRKEIAAVGCTSRV